MKHIRLRLLVASAFTLLVAACSQAPTPQAQSETPLAPQFGTPYEDTGDNVFASKRTDAIYVTGGLTRSVSDIENRINTDGFLRRYESDNTLVWKKQFNATTYEDITDLAEDSQGNIIVAVGKNSGDSNGTSELFKYTATGQELWRSSLDGVRRVFSIDTTPTDGFYLVGDDSSFRGFIRNYNQDGILLWAKQLSRNDFFGPSATDANGNLYTVRKADYIDVSDSIYKFDPAGRLVWKRLIPKGTADSIYVQDIVVDKDALYLLGGKYWILKNTEYEFESETDIAIAKYNFSGKRLWAKSFGTRDFDQGVALSVDNEHNVYVAAYLDTSDYRSPTIRTYTSEGRLVKQITTESLKQPTANVNDIAVRGVGELYITGRASGNLGAGYKGGDSDAFLARLEGKGNRVWIR